MNNIMLTDICFLYKKKHKVDTKTILFSQLKRFLHRYCGESYVKDRKRLCSIIIKQLLVM